MDDEGMGEAVVADTFLRVKGLERPAVIITDLGLLGDMGGDEGERSTTREVRMHIALTRAMVAVRIVATKQAIHDDPVLAEFL